jgi:hypothetical protein
LGARRRAAAIEQAAGRGIGPDPKRAAKQSLRDRASAPRAIENVARGASVIEASELRLGRLPRVLVRPALALLLLACGGPTVQNEPDPAEQCGGFERLALGEPQPLLADHLRIRALEGARSFARPQAPTAAPEPDAGATRLFLEAGDRKFVVMSMELFRRRTENFLAGVRAIDRPAQFDRLVPTELASGLDAVVVIPGLLDTSSEAVNVLRVYVASRDDSVQVVMFFVNPAVAREASGCPGLARRLAETIAPGERRLTASAGERELAHGVTIALPDGYAVLEERGADFSVHRIYPLLPLDGASGSLAVYLGPRPDAGPIEPGTGVRGTLFGREVEWREVQTEDGAIGRETIAPVAEGGSLLAHVYLAADRADLADELVRVAQTLRVR